VKRLLRPAATGLAALSFSLSTVACGQSSDHALPAEMCGTEANTGLVKPLVADGGDWNEFARVDRKRSVTAPCVLLSGPESVLDFRFSWTKDKPDLMYLAGTGSVSGVRDPLFPWNWPRTRRSAPTARPSRPPATRGTPDYFTLGLQLPRVALTDRGHREDIERFMRQYFPATVRTLDCR
jgi:hypothetical protein